MGLGPVGGECKQEIEQLAVILRAAHAEEYQLVVEGAPGIDLVLRGLLVTVTGRLCCLTRPIEFCQVDAALVTSARPRWRQLS